MKKAKESVYEYYDFSLSQKENVFMTKVVQKYRLFSSLYEDSYAYMSQWEKKILLGDPTFKKRIENLKNMGVLSEIPVGKNPKNAKQFIWGYIPRVVTYIRKNAYLPFLDKYHMVLKEQLSPEAANIYDTLKCSSIDISDYQLAEALVNSCHRHGYPDPHQYLDENMESLKECIQDFNSNSSMYIVEDPFGNRVHTFVSKIPKEIRTGYVFINGNPTVELDLHQSQMVILGKLLDDMYGINSFSRKVKESDIYLDFGYRNGITDRGEAKKFMYRALFNRKGSKADLMFKEAYPDAYPFIRNIKSIHLPQNPSWKWHSNLAYMLQQEESGIFRNLWSELQQEGIKFLTAHDSIIVKDSDGDSAEEIMRRNMELQIGNHTKIDSSYHKHTLYKYNTSYIVLV